MSTKFSVVHDLDVPAEKLWEFLFNPELEQSCAKAANLAEYDVQEFKDSPAGATRRIHVTPQLDIPAVFKKLVGNSLGYLEENRVPKGQMYYDWSVRTDALGDKAEMGGRFKVEPLGPNRCRRTISGEAHVKIFGIGKLAEKYVVDELDKNYAIVAREQERWIKAKLG